jgi:RNA polymerase sigma-70 factor (ECF subfamily)
MHEHDWLAARFDEHRNHLRAVAYRILGSPSEADDALQEAWLRLSRAETGEVRNLGGYLTTVVARVCLNMLRSRHTRREELFGEYPAEPVADRAEATDPEYQAVLADSLGLALLVVLDTLPPTERLAFVLHDMFDVPFEQIAPIIERSPAAARQLASRARRRVRGADATAGTDPGRQREIVTAFLAASQNGDFEALLALLHPDAVVRVDAAALRMGAPEAQGAEAVAGIFAGRAQVAQTALIDGVAGLVWAMDGKPRVVFRFTVAGGRVTAIDMVADPDRVSHLDLAILDG